MSTTLAPAAVSRPAAAAAPWAAGWAVLAAGAAALLWVLATDVWPKRPEMGDRFLIPIASAVLMYLLASRWRSVPCAPARSGLLAVAAGAVGFPPAWYLLVRVGPRTLLLWWLAVALGIAAVGLLAAGHGWKRVRVLLFPIVFALFALPTPDALQSRLLPTLKAATTAGAAAVLPWLGVPAERAGYTLNLPSGPLGVVDACSGALSLVSLLAISVLTAYVRYSFRRDFTVGRGVVLVALTLPIVVASNTVRVIATGVLKEYVGDWAIAGAYHEALGYLVILVGFGLIVGTSQKLALKKVGSEEQGSEEKASSLLTPHSSLLSPLLAAAMLLPAAALCLWSEQFRQAHFQLADLRAVATDLPGWQGTDLPVPPDVAEMLKCDQLIHRSYEDHLGRTGEVYLMFWATPASTAHIHHPDVCWPSRGCTLAESRVRPVPYTPGREPLGVSVRHYDDPRGRREVVFYWTQNGADVLPDGREPADRGSEYAWVAEMLRGGRPAERVSRLSVLLSADVPVGRPADQEGRLADLAGRVAAEVYRVCPWAEPQH